MEQGKEMGPYFAVFNAHKNNARERALEEMGKHYPTWKAEVEKAIEEHGGPMGLFHQAEPSAAEAVYIALVTLFVNQGA